MRSKCNQVVLHAEISPAATVLDRVCVSPRLSILFSSEIISVERRERDGGGVRTFDRRVSRIGRIGVVNGDRLLFRAF